MGLRWQKNLTGVIILPFSIPPKNKSFAYSSALIDTSVVLKQNFTQKRKLRIKASSRVPL